jgi:hypothetical protein
MYRRLIAPRTPSNPSFIGRTQLRFFEGDNGNNPAGGTGSAGIGGQGDTDRQNLQGLLARHQGDALAVVATLLSENHSLRDERRVLRGQLPAQGAVVLSPEQATQWQNYQQLGAVDVLTSALTERTTLQGQLTGMQREKLIGDVASLANYKASVLGQLPGADKLTFEIRESTVDGKQVKAVVVKDGTAETPLTQYAQTHWADFLPALQAAPAQQQAAGTTFVAQNPGGGQPASPLDAYAKKLQEQRDSVPNPLSPVAARSPIA